MYSERFFRSGTLRIHFRDWGNDGAPPLIIVHGLRDLFALLRRPGARPRRPTAEVGWTVEGFARIDRALAGHPGLKDLDAAYHRLRERNPRLSEAKARELALLGTRAIEDGTLEWKFDPMLATMSSPPPDPLRAWSQRASRAA